MIKVAPFPKVYYVPKQPITSKASTHLLLRWGLIYQSKSGKGSLSCQESVKTKIILNWLTRCSKR